MKENAYNVFRLLTKSFIANAASDQFAIVESTLNSLKEKKKQNRQNGLDTIEQSSFMFLLLTS